MKNVVFWDIKTQSVLHRKHITSLLQNPAAQYYVRYEVLTAVTMKNAIFWDVEAWSPVKMILPINFRLHLQGGKNQ
jgi:hypothetical protein